MLDHTKPYIEKIHYINAELEGHVHKLDVKPQSLCGSGFSLLLCAFLPNLIQLWSELPNNTAKTKMGYISLPSILNAIIGV